MARIKVQLADNIKRVVFLEEGATVGATIGTDLKLPDGSVATLAALQSYLGISTSASTTQAHRLLSGLTLGDDHPQYTRRDILTTRGDLYVQGASSLGRLGVGTASQFFQSNGTDPAWQTISPVITLGTDLSGSATLTNLTSATLNGTIVANAVSDSKLRQSAGLSVIGRSANSTGNVADITSAADGDVLRRSGTSIGFGNIGANPSVSVGLSAHNGTANTYMRSDASPALDVTISPTWSGTHTFSNTPVVPSASWTYAKIQNVSATSRILGRITAGAGSIEELTGTQATTLLDTFTSLLKGLVPASGGGTTNFLRADGSWAAPSGSSGTVTSVALSDASSTAIYAVSGSPVTTSGTLTITLNTQSANKVFAGPTTGSAAQPTFRSLVAADIPALGANPSASVGLSAANGSATTYMRSDAAPALDVTISPTWTNTHTFAPASPIGIIINGPTGSGAALRLVDGGTGNRAYEVNVGEVSVGSFSIYDRTAGADRLSIASTGNVTINAPSSGIAITANGVSGADIVKLVSGTGAAASGEDLGVYRAGSTANAIQQGPNLTLFDSTNITVSTIQQSGGQTEFWQYNGSWNQWMKVSSSRNVTINAPSSGNALTVNGVVTTSAGQSSFYEPSYSVAAAANVATSSSGTFTGTLTGMSTTITGTVRYTRTGDMVILTLDSQIVGTSNLATMTMTGLPAAITPARDKFFYTNVENNGGQIMGAVLIASSGTLTFYTLNTNLVTNNVVTAASGFTGSGTKGLPEGPIGNSYPISV